MHTDEELQEAVDDMLRGLAGTVLPAAMIQVAHVDRLDTSVIMLAAKEDVMAAPLTTGVADRDLFACATSLGQLRVAVNIQPVEVACQIIQSVAPEIAARLQEPLAADYVRLLIFAFGHVFYRPFPTIEGLAEEVKKGSN